MPAAAPPAPAAPAAPAAPPGGAAAPPSLSPMEQSFADMERFADMDDEPSQPEAKPAKPAAKAPPAKPPAKAPPAKPDPKKAAPAKPPTEESETETVDDDGEQRADLEAPQKDDGTTPDPKAPKGQRLKPWDLVDRFKNEAATLRRENEELKAKQNSREVPKEAMDKITALESRNKELEEEIRFVNYEKSQEYQETFHKPYLEAWQRALSELSEFTITDGKGGSRPAGVDELVALARMSTPKARELAQQLFGDSADDIMAHRRVVRELAEKQHKALDDARKNGGEREKQANLERETKEKANAERIGKEWDTINRAAVEKYEFLRPVDGQAERNAKLEQAVKFVDDSFALSLSQAKTEQERQDILRRHSALRNRAIGFSVFKHENKALRAEIEELKKSLAEYQKSEPTAGEQGHDKGSSMVTDPMEAAMQGLANLAE